MQPSCQASRTAAGPSVRLPPPDANPYPGQTEHTHLCTTFTPARQPIYLDTVSAAVRKGTTFREMVDRG